MGGILVMFKGVVFLACLVTCCSALVPCHAGFFGSKGQVCRECPHNTYKDYIGFASSCKPCPVNSGHNLLGSHIFSDCKCLKGYSGDPMQDIPCTIRLCDPFAPPINGSLVGVCNSEYNSVCRIKCNEGYELEGGSAHADRKCIVNKNNHMEWTGGRFYCSPIRCPLVRVSNADPPYGVCSSGAYAPRYKTRCSFKCDRGYRLKGSKERVCQLDKTWSGIPTICEAIYCPKLSPVKFATVQPPECVTQPIKFGRTCQFRCPDGYFTDDELHETTAYLGCLHNGTWDVQVPNCVDRQPPRMSCPLSKIRGVTTKGKATGNVSWSIKVTDNSEIVDPNAKITVDSSHQPSQEFPIGETLVRIIATDSAGNVGRECIFKVEIRDNEPPTFSKCPKDIVREEKVSQIRVNWEHPVFSDNSGVLPSVTSSFQTGATFRVPGNYKNTYSARDRSGNENKNCTFRIILKKKTCQIFPPPRNGALVCMTTEVYLNCAVMCSSGTDFEDTPPLLYYCAGGEWNYLGGLLPRYKNSNPWPNCSFNAGPSEIKKLNWMHYYSYNGDAHNANVQNNIKENFFKLLKDPFFIPPFFCMEENQCIKDKIAVSAGVVG